MLVLERKESKMEVIIKFKIRLYPVLVGCSSSIPKLAVNNKDKAFGGMITESSLVETLLQFFLAGDLTDVLVANAICLLGSNAAMILKLREEIE